MAKRASAGADLPTTQENGTRWEYRIPFRDLPDVMRGGPATELGTGSRSPEYSPDEQLLHQVAQCRVRADKWKLHSPGPFGANEMKSKLCKQQTYAKAKSTSAQLSRSLGLAEKRD
ncbi:hypothetical protein UY3_18863 [Chelonia mydas]|uniref:Uncharacterized protein n=1 Tax=Chelonia mydas TaxID=8469 RepID=M7AH07_CHEMY|nr:hypothetical protein UY3_18863 [Chelonia mydas]